MGGNLLLLLGVAAAFRPRNKHQPERALALGFLPIPGKKSPGYIKELWLQPGPLSDGRSYDILSIVGITVTPSRIFATSPFKFRFLRPLYTASILFLLASALAQVKTDSREPYKWSWKLSRGWPAQPSLKTAQLSRAERDAIFKASFAAFVSDKNWSQYISPGPEWRRAIWEARIKLIDLDGDGTPEVLLMGSGLESSGDGNSSFRILKKQGTHYKVILDTIAEQVTVDTRFDPKHPIVTLYGHYSASDGDLELYRIGSDGHLHNTANYLVTWPVSKGAFEAPPTLERTDHRSPHFDH